VSLENGIIQGIVQVLGVPAELNEARLIKPISPRRLRDGEAALLQVLNKDHHIAILGIKLAKPLLNKRLPLPRRS